VGHQLHADLRDRVVDDAAVRGHALVQFDDLIGRQRRGEHVHHAVVEHVGGVDDVRGHRRGAHLADHFRLHRVVVEHRHVFTRRRRQGVDLLVVDEQVGAAAGGDTGHHVIPLHHVLRRCGVGEHLQQNAHVLLAGQPADGVDGAGVGIEQPRAQAAHQRRVTEAGFEFIHHHPLVGIGNQIQLDTVFEQPGALILRRREDRPVAADNVPDADLAGVIAGFAQAGQFAHGVDALGHGQGVVVDGVPQRGVGRGRRRHGEGHGGAHAEQGVTQ